MSASISARPNFSFVNSNEDLDALFHAKEMSYSEALSMMSEGIKTLKCDHSSSLDVAKLYSEVISSYVLTKESNQKKNILIRLIFKIVDFVVGYSRKFDQFIDVFNSKYSFGPGANVYMMGLFEENEHKSASDILFQYEKNRLLQKNCSRRGREILEKSDNFTYVKAPSTKLAMFHYVTMESKDESEGFLSSLMNVVSDIPKAGSDFFVSATALGGVGLGMTERQKELNSEEEINPDEMIRTGDLSKL